MSASIAIHGHFYQPPRENPFTGEVPHDQFVEGFSNGVFHNWNEVINNECYKPNANLDNFSLITFDLYRTLADWLKNYDKNTYDTILKNDEDAYSRDGLGSALCGSWDHAILPLLSDEDIELEIYWGCRDYASRFSHEPVGFWLAETAVSKKVLDSLVKNGIRLVILATHQVGYQVDPTKLYWVELYEGRRIVVAFYDKSLSDALSFDNAAMSDANLFAQNYIAQRPLKDEQFLLGATDGERYGHHLKGGAEFLNHFVTKSLSAVHRDKSTVMKLYLEKPIVDQVYITENSSWSCLCGDLKRWKEDCNCCVDYNRNNMRVSGEWKRILHEAVIDLSQSLVSYTNGVLSYLVEDALLAKKEYILVRLGKMTQDQYIKKHAIRELEESEVKGLMNVMEMQIYRLAAFTSCGWFFSDIDRPEPRITIANAKKALSYLELVGQQKLMVEQEKIFLNKLKQAHSNTTEKTGLDLYNELGELLSAKKK